MIQVHAALDRILTGELQGTTGVEQMPDIPCDLVKFKAQVGNSGNVYIGSSREVTKPDGNNDTTTGFELDAGQETDWMPVSNLKHFWRTCDNSGDDLTYIALTTPRAS